MRFILLLGACLASVLFGAPAVRADSIRESPRCTAHVASGMEDQVRSFEGHPPAASARDERFAALNQLIASEMQEDDILIRACNNDADLVPIQADLRASEAMAYALQSDLARDKYAAACPAAAAPVASGLLAAAWRQLALAAPETAAQPKSVKAAADAIRPRATAVKLALPAFEDASSYWLTTIQKASQAAALACPQ